MSSPFTMKKDLAQFGERLYQRGLVAGTDGNLSARLSDGRIMITPSGLPKGFLSPEDMVVVDENGKILQGSRKPSSEMPMHLFVYRNRPDINSCIHSHAPYLTAFAIAGIQLAANILPEIVLSVGNIPLTAYAPPGTEEVAKSLEPHIEQNNAFALRNHGLLTIGHSLEEAYNRHETVEHYARIVYLARKLGELQNIPSDDFQRLEKMRRKLDEAWREKQ